MKTKLFVILVALLISSCELIEPFLNPTTSGCVLQKTQWSIPAPDLAQVDTEYSYDSLGKLTEIVRKHYDRPVSYRPYYQETWEIHYSGDTVVQIVAYTKFKDNATETDGVYTFFYNGNQPDSITYTRGQTYNNATGFFAATYANKKLIAFVNYGYDLSTNRYDIRDTTSLEWTGDNITKTTSLNYLNEQTIREYEYDDKHTPFDQIGLAFSSFGSLTMLSNNNVKSSKITQWNGNVLNISFDLTYNNNDYPISVDPSNDQKTTYQYTCN